MSSSPSLTCPASHSFMSLLACADIARAFRVSFLLAASVSLLSSILHQKSKSQHVCRLQTASCGLVVSTSRCQPANRAEKPLLCAEAEACLGPDIAAHFLISSPRSASAGALLSAHNFTTPDVAQQLLCGTCVLVQLLLQSRLGVGEGLAPPQGFPSQLLLTLAQGQLGSAVPAVLHGKQDLIQLAD